MRSNEYERIIERQEEIIEQLREEIIELKSEINDIIIAKIDLLELYDLKVKKGGEDEDLR